MDRAAELVPYFKSAYRTRVVVVPHNPSGRLLHWLEQAGADVILPIPFTLEQFGCLVGSCVSQPCLVPGT
jgi:hypothetical protein